MNNIFIDKWRLSFLLKHHIGPLNYVLYWSMMFSIEPRMVTNIEQAVKSLLNTCLSGVDSYIHTIEI